MLIFTPPWLFANNSNVETGGLRYICVRKDLVSPVTVIILLYFGLKNSQDEKVICTHAYTSITLYTWPNVSD